MTLRFLAAPQAFDENASPGRETTATVWRFTTIGQLLPFISRQKTPQAVTALEALRRIILSTMVVLHSGDFLFKSTPHRLASVKN
jgi:hypothetical protein